MSTAETADELVDLVPEQKLLPKRPPIENVPGRLGPPWFNRVRAVAGSPWKMRLARAALYIPKVRYWEAQYLPAADEEMRLVSMQLRGRARGGANLDKLISRIREAAQQGAQVICTQELFRSQYFCQLEDPKIFDLAEPIPPWLRLRRATTDQELDSLRARHLRFKLARPNRR